MNCKNHPHVAAIGRCAGCAQPFCSNCLAGGHGQKYCRSCEVLAIRGQPEEADTAIPCREAGEALTYAIVGLFCLSIFLDPIAIVKALQAKKLIRANPRLTGSNKATAALVIACIGLGLWLVVLTAQIVKLW